LTTHRYQNFVFSPADLAEDVDLDLERRKEILFAQAHVDDWTHYQVLDIPWGSGAEVVRAAYLEKAKIFHPDRYPGRRLGSYRTRLEQVFRRITQARDVLATDDTREAYAKKTAPPDEFARMETRRLEDENRAQERRERLKRANPLVARAAQVAELMKRGREAMEKERFAQAANDFMTVVSLDPRHAEARALAMDAKKRAGAEKAKAAYERGIAAQVLGKTPDALACFLEAVEADDSNPRYLVSAARTQLKVGDQEAARQLAESALRTASRYAPAHEVFGEVLLAQGLSREARKAFERAVELDPGLESARSQLKKLRWSFLR
jgi:tetratricopeptide (TPR) repeat protein